MSVFDGNEFSLKAASAPEGELHAGDALDARRISTTDHASISPAPADPASTPLEWLGQCGAVEIYLARDLKAVRDLWRGFETRCAYTPFQSYDWITTWFDQNGAGVDPVIVLAFHGGRLRLLAPMCGRRHFGAFRLGWLAEDVNDYDAPMIDPLWAGSLRPGCLATLWRHILSLLSGPDCGADYAVFTKQPALIGDVANPVASFCGEPYSAKSYRAAFTQPWAEFYAAQRSSKTRARLRSRENRLRRAGTVTMRRIRGSFEMSEKIATIIQWKSDQLDARGSRNPFKTGKLGALLSKLCAHDHPATGLRVYVLEVSGRMLAGAIMLIGREDAKMFINAYDPKADLKASPGTLLLKKLMEMSCRAGLKRFDFLLGDEAYKTEWGGRPLTVGFFAEGYTAKGRALAGFERAALRAKRAMKARPWLMRLLEQANANLFTGNGDEPGARAASNVDAGAEKKTKAAPCGVAVHRAGTVPPCLGPGPDKS